MSSRDLHLEHGTHLLPEPLVPVKLNESWAARRLMEALNSLPPNNMSNSLDSRFQQKMTQEREQKRNELMIGKANAVKAVNGNDTPVGSKDIGNGKVRQMFDERRRGAGIDRSHPLKPISSTGNPNTTQRATPLPKSLSTANTGINKSRTQTTPAARGRLVAGLNRTAERRPAANGHNVNNNYVNGHDEYDHLAAENAISDRVAIMNLNGNGADYDNNNTNGIKLNPVVTRKSPTTKRETAPLRSGGINGNPRTSTIANNPPRSTLPARRTPTMPSAPAIKSPQQTSRSPLAPSTTVPPGMASCRYCQRNFLSERLEKHEAICAKTQNTKRKVFDSTKARVKGTDAEKYIRKGRVAAKKPAAVPNTSTRTAASTGDGGAKKGDWRRKHEEFIAAIRAAKAVKAHLAKGGKLSDLPPPPPSENPDYVQCPHCSRRFNETAAARHIPKCATMLHNKPKGFVPKRK